MSNGSNGSSELCTFIGILTNGSNDSAKRHMYVNKIKSNIKKGWVPLLSLLTKGIGQ